MAFTLLSTKLHRPRPTAALVARPRLTRRLDEGLRSGRRLSLVVAPAGYGKTTLVAEWLDKTPIPSAWLSLDEADNDPLRFFTYLVAALQKVLGPQVALPPQETFPGMPRSPEALVYPLINDLTALGQPVLLALDDYHVIADGLIHDAMVLLLRRAPPDLHLVVLTRADPPFPLPRLRVRDRVTEIREHDLRLTPDEMTSFLNSLHHLDLPAEQIAALEARTEGWAAGVQLAALSLQGYSAKRAAEFITAFSGSHHYIVDYLVEEVLSRQPDPVREFLLQTSLLDQMCAPLCDALSPAFQARQTLETLERAGLFLVPLDDERRWVRYHHLFTDVLRQMLASSVPPDQVARLHNRASDWYGQNGFVADAYRHALLAGNGGRAVALLEENAWPMVLHAEFATLRRWLQALPTGLLSQNPWLCICYAWALVFGESEAAEAQLQAAEQGLPASGSTLPPAQMQGHIAAVRAWIAYGRGEPDRAAVLSRRALELSPQMDPAIRCGLMALVGVACRTQGDLAGAARAFTEARDVAQATGNILVEVAACTSLGELSQMAGRLHEAEAIYRQALQRAVLLQSPVVAQAYLMLAALHRQWNDLASARQFAEKAVEGWRRWGYLDSVAEAYLHLAGIEQAQGNLAGANSALAHAFQVVQGHTIEPRLVPSLGAMRARLWLAQGKRDDARRWAEERGLSAEGSFDLTNEVEYLALARLLLAEGRVDEAERLLSRLQEAIESSGRHGTLVEVLVLQAMACDLQHESPSALALLERALALARPGGYVRVFLDEGKPLEALLRAVAARARDHDLLAYLRTLLDAFAGEGAPPTPRRAPPPALLSERELDVLRLIAAGCSNQEIAEKLVIAVGTAKRHTANLFDKLDVRSRTEAVAQARRLGLL